MAKKYQLTPTIKQLLIDISLKKDTYLVLEELRQYFGDNFHDQQFGQKEYFNRIVYKQILLFKSTNNEELDFAKCFFILTIGSIHFKKENYHDAIRAFHKISSFFNKYDLNQYWKELQIRQFINIGVIHYHRNDLYSSIYYLNKSEHLILQNGAIKQPERFLLHITNNLGIAYARIDLNKELDYRTKSNELAVKLNNSNQEFVHQAF
jgi:tetratricopeptide (TPR) repeat protein